MSTSDERAASNGPSFRAANDRIAVRRAELGRVEGPTPFLCECDDPACTAIVRLSTDDYARVRSEPSRFVIVPGHSLRGAATGIAGEGVETGLAGDGWVCVRREEA